VRFNSKPAGSGNQAQLATSIQVLSMQNMHILQSILEHRLPQTRAIAGADGVRT